MTYALIATERVHRVHRVSAALGGTAALVLVGIVDADTAFYSEQTGIDWNVIFLLLGTMIIVSVFNQTGVFEYTVGDRYLLAATGPLFASAVLGAFVDNIPYTAAMAPIVENLVAAAPDPALGQPLWWAFALGADLGGNTTAVAAGANVTTVTLVLAWAYVSLRCYAFV